MDEIRRLLDEATRNRTTKPRIETVWQGHFVMSDEKRPMSRGVIGQSVDGFHGGIEIRRGKGTEIEWSSGVPTKTQAAMVMDDAHDRFRGHVPSPEEASQIKEVWRSEVYQMPGDGHEFYGVVGESPAGFHPGLLTKEGTKEIVDSGHATDTEEWAQYLASNDAWLGKKSRMSEVFDDQEKPERRRESRGRD